MSTTAQRKKAASWKPAVPDKRRRALEVMQASFTRTGRVLSGNYDLRAHVHRDRWAPAPAWSDSDNIWVDQQQATPMQTEQDYGTMMGLNYHELAHVIWTPSVREMDARGGAKMARVLKQAGVPANQTYLLAWNLLEDARIETLIVGMYPYLKDYLTLTFIHYIIGDGSKVDELFLFSRGRRYLPRPLRVRARRKFKSKKHLRAISRIIDEYRLLNMRKGADLDRGHELVIELVDILNEITPPPVFNHVCSGHQLASARDIGPMNKGEGSAAATDGVIVKVKKAEEQTDTENTESTEQATTSGGAGDGAGEKGQGNTEGDSGSGDGKGEGKQAGGNGKGHLEADSDDESKTDAELVADAAAGAAGSERIKADMRGVLKVVAQSDNLDPFTPRNSGRVHVIPPELPILVRKTTRELRRIEEDSDPHWKTHTTTGRLNMRRAMRNPDGDDLHDEWAEGQMVGTDMELVVLLDVSSSMSQHEDALGRASWVIKRASDVVRVTCTVLAYSSSDGRSPAHSIVYGPKDRAEGNAYPRVPTAGGTTPATCLNEAHRVLALSKKRHRALVIMTDGAWTIQSPNSVVRQSGGRFVNCHDIIDDLNARGVLTAMALLGMTVTEEYIDYYRHHCQTFKSIRTLEELPGFVRDQLVTELKRG